MTKEYIIIATLMLIALTASFVMAQDVVLGVGEVVGIPDSEAEITTTAVSETTIPVIPTTDLPQGTETTEEETTSTVEIATETVKSWFTFNQEKRAMLELKIANLRLIQARIAAKNGNEKAMTKALEAHDRILERVKSRIQKMDGNKDEAGLKNSAEKLVGLERAIQNHEQKIANLQEKLANANLTAEQKTRIEAKISNVQENTAKLQELQNAKKEEVKTKLRAVTGKTDEEINQIVQEIENSQPPIRERERKAKN